MTTLSLINSPNVFSVQSLNTEDLKPLGNTLKSWQKRVTAFSKELKNSTNTDLKDQVESLQYILRTAFRTGFFDENESRSLESYGFINEIWRCNRYQVDRQDPLEGLIIFKYKPIKWREVEASIYNGNLSVVALFSHPKNLGLPLESSEVVTRGTGRILLDKAKERCLELDLKGIELASLVSAQEFYLNRGFIVDEGGFVMTITAEKIREEIESSISRSLSEVAI